jgi:hypothetical protein
MTAPIDLEALRKTVTDAIGEASKRLQLGKGGPCTAELLDTLHEPIDAALAELTTRRARDAEVEALVAATKKALMRFNDMNGQVSAEVWNDNWPTIKACRDALAPFTGAAP